MPEWVRNSKGINQHAQKRTQVIQSAASMGGHIPFQCPQPFPNVFFCATITVTIPISFISQYLLFPKLALMSLLLILCYYH